MGEWIALFAPFISVFCF